MIYYKMSMTLPVIVKHLQIIRNDENLNNNQNKDLSLEVILTFIMKRDFKYLLLACILAFCTVACKKEELGNTETLEPFAITPLEGKTSVSISSTNNSYEVALIYSTDGIYWRDYRLGKEITVDKGVKLRFKAGTLKNLKETNDALFASSSQYVYVTADKGISVSGHIITLLDAKNTNNLLQDGGKCEFAYLFKDNTNLSSELLDVCRIEM